MAKQAMRQARMHNDDGVVQMLLESRLVATTKAGRTWAVTEKARQAARDRGFQILTEGEFSFLQKVEYLCPVGHQFTVEPQVLCAVKTAMSSMRQNRGTARMQVNVRLPIEHTQKYLELIEYYRSKEGIAFLGEEMSSSELESNSTALGRFLLETAIDDAYMELKDQKAIEIIASWIGFEQYKGIASIVRDLGTNPARHKKNNSDEWQAFRRGRPVVELSTTTAPARQMEWGEGIGDTYYTPVF